MQAEVDGRHMADARIDRCTIGQLANNKLREGKNCILRTSNGIITLAKRTTV